MILNFYLRRHRHKGEMRAVERQNLAKVRHLLIARGMKNVSKLDSHEAIQTLAKRVAELHAQSRHWAPRSGHCGRYP